MLRARKNGRGALPRREKNLGFVKIAHGLCRISAGTGQSSAAMIRHLATIASRLDPRRGYGH
jgi:hypothetical protein